jgi:hypothetical protein
MEDAMSKRKDKAATPAGRGSSRRRERRPPGAGRQEPRSRIEESDIPDERAAHHETSPLLSGGDVDADWQAAGSTGEEAVGGSVATPDQDIVDALGEALGVPQAPDAELTTSREMLEDRDAHRWRIEREIARDDRD